jgi:hypothetical protein
MIWDFLERYDESWIWRCTDRHTVTESRRNFAALDECIDDAVTHGYARAGPAQDERPRARRAEPVKLQPGRTRRAGRR